MAGTEGFGQLKSPQTEEKRTPMAPGARELPSEQGRAVWFAEIVAALKAKADDSDARHDEIEAELRSVEGQMDQDEAITVAKRVGIVRHLNSRNDAVEEIRRKVFEMKRAHESIAY
ncbi:MAG TPA: hypothetical protein VN688_27025 [Gemmataceae bacterium]|nr:hypothetical protein [Gemmataceae bacterium]